MEKSLMLFLGFEQDPGNLVGFGSITGIFFGVGSDLYHHEFKAQNSSYGVPKKSHMNCVTLDNHFFCLKMLPPKIHVKKKNHSCI